MKYYISVLILFVLFSCSVPKNTDNVKTIFQTAAEWRPEIDNRADAVMVYGTAGNPSDSLRSRMFENRVASWREKGYETEFMTGIAWGEYEDYFTGKWDGKNHLDEGQVQENGDTIWHGKMIPYIVPCKDYLGYFKEKQIKRVLDAGVSTIFLEEPEFWARAGYSEAFKKEWEKYYGFPWRPQDSSPENTYLSSKLKYHLYYEALKDVLTYAKQYGAGKGMDVKCYVATHSLLNYSQWRIVSPEASLASLPCVDGYIAQVWTGTSREPDYYDGVYKERVFETAYLEYGCMESMTAPTGRRVYFLTDPVEDRARDWNDYKRNYQATFSAQLLFPRINHYEIMPWPERVYCGYYKTDDSSNEKTLIRKDYSTMMQVMINSLNKMPVSDNQLSGSQGIGVLMSNSLMFQRFPEHDGYEDPQLSDFYGMAMPFVKRGVPVKIVHMENLGYKAALSGIKVLIMTYSNMKPLNGDSHLELASWVKKGGILIYSSRDDDPFQSVREWWNTDGNDFKRPSDHLFSLMGIPSGAPEGLYDYGKGKVMVLRHDPKEYVLAAGGDGLLIDAVSRLYGPGLKFRNYFYLERGPYIIAAALDESEDETPVVIKGKLIDLFDPDLNIYYSKRIAPGSQGYFYDIDKAVNAKAGVLASSSRIYDEKVALNSYDFVSKSPVNTENVARILLPSCPESVLIDGKESLSKESWDKDSRTYLIRFANKPEGVAVHIEW
ncbi:MAG: hypothetical protein LKI42_00365 [Bacteroidales bacterium]|jgi:hypothetical protein|nr:hypothetical protein [Bacteroidales bacterium]MCI1786261.1 hypothetical protein [Bacteroidales bacterium]